MPIRAANELFRALRKEIEKKSKYQLHPPTREVVLTHLDDTEVPFKDGMDEIALRKAREIAERRQLRLKSRFDYSYPKFTKLIMEFER
ncbi:MAG: hypothetical protein Q8R15_02185 [Candidatus Micrarchaeota archaeon]|nr:hypothetical protein [Candidatus Micrarchaeota archaeon]